VFAPDNGWRLLSLLSVSFRPTSLITQHLVCNFLHFKRHSMAEYFKKPIIFGHEVFWTLVTRSE
jgi:hypothetical protein